MMASDTNETIADIIAEMRKRKDMLANAAHSSPLCYSVDTMSAQAELLDEFIERLESAWKRERAFNAMTEAANERLREHLQIALDGNKKPVGNAAAMREALELCMKDMCHYCKAEARACDLPQCLDGCETLKEAKAALSAPARNCDRFQVAAEALQEWQLLVKAKPNTWDFRYNYWLFALADERKGGRDE